MANISYMNDQMMNQLTQYRQQVSKLFAPNNKVTLFTENDFDLQAKSRFNLRDDNVAKKNYFVLFYEQNVQNVDVYINFCRVANQLVAAAVGFAAVNLTPDAQSGMNSMSGSMDMNGMGGGASAPPVNSEIVNAYSEVKSNPSHILSWMFPSLPVIIFYRNGWPQEIVNLNLVMDPSSLQLFSYMLSDVKSAEIKRSVQYAYSTWNYMR